MARIYNAILRGDRVEWIDAPPEHPDPTPVQIMLTALPDTAPASQGPAMADILESLADAGGISSIPDPVAWQRETRQDPSLPKRGA